LHGLRLNQVTLGAFDFAASVSFYQRLGLKLIVDSAPRYVRFEFPESEDRTPPATLSLHEVSDDWAAPADYPLIYFEVDDVAGFLALASRLIQSAKAIFNRILRLTNNRIKRWRWTHDCGG